MSGTRTAVPWGRRLRAVLALVALAEIAALLGLARLIGAAAAVLILLGFSVAGVVVLRYAVRRLLQPPGAGESGTAMSGQAPRTGPQVTEALPLLGAGILMTVPGLLTGVLGTLLLLAPVRMLLRPLAVRAAWPVVARMQRRSGNPIVVPGEVVDDPPTAQHVDVEIIEISELDPGAEGDDPPSRS